MEQLQLFEIAALPEVEGSQSSSTETKRVRAKVAPLIPAEVIVAAVELMGAIDLDPYCINKSTTLIPAKIRYGLDENGLGQAWGPPKRRVFLVPPTGRATANWMNKLCDEYEAGNIAQGVAYIRAALDSDWWNRLISYPMCVVHRQLRVVSGSHGASVPWAVVYLGTNFTGFGDAFSEVGTLYLPYKRKAAPAEPAPARKKSRADESALRKAAKPDATGERRRERTSSGSQTFKIGETLMTIHASACYVTLANDDWDARDETRLRTLILAIPGVLPSQYSSVSKTEDGTTRLVFSFKRGYAQDVSTEIRNVLNGSPTTPLPQSAPVETTRRIKRALR